MESINGIIQKFFGEIILKIGYELTDISPKVGIFLIFGTQCISTSICHNRFASQNVSLKTVLCDFGSIAFLVV